MLLLGGTTQASLLASALAGRKGVAATLSLAGRTSTPAASPLPMRVGGFGGVEGLIGYLKTNRIDVVVDATHPYAAQMSAHALAACRACAAPLAAFTRAPWTPEPADDWREVDGAPEAAQALGDAARRVFLTIGRLQTAAFRAAPQHHYLLRSIDAPPPEDLPPSHALILERPPFTLQAEIELMRNQRIDMVVSKNAGGQTTRAKIDAARALRLPVVMIRRPPLGPTKSFYDLASTLNWIEAHRGAS